MAPPVQPADKEPKRVKLILSFASDLQAGLAAAASAKEPGTLFTQLENQVTTFPSKLAASSKAGELDSAGTILWNLCTRLRRDVENPEKAPIILLVGRVFAFLLLGCAHDSGKGTISNLVRLMKIGIKAAKNCLDLKQWDYTLKVLEKVAHYESILHKQTQNPSPEDEALYGTLSAEYYILRTALAWKQEQFEMADHMFNKSMASKHFFNPKTAESLADVLFELGKDLLSRKQSALAVKWLDRAYEIIGSQELDRLSADAGELRMSILQMLVKALLDCKDLHSYEKASGIVATLESEVGDKLIVLLLRLEMITRSSEEFDGTGYNDILQKMIRVVPLHDANFKLIMYHIRKLNEKRPSLGCKALDDFVRLRVLHAEREEWLEKVLVTRMWMAIGQRDSPEALMFLERFLTTVVDNMKRPVSSAATLAAHTLLWKRIEANCTQRDYESAEKWCRLAMHRAFEKCGELNSARISRKLLLCALARQDISSARDVFGSMSEAAKNEPMTRFLIYKIAIRCDDPELASECLEVVSSSSGSDPKLLYACVLDAQQVGSKTQALAALQLVLENCGYDAPQSRVHLPSLLRITIGLMVALLEASKDPVASHIHIEKLCKMFEAAVKSAKKTPVSAADSMWNILELEWFSKNSYNLAIKNLPRWYPRYSLRMLICCIDFINQYPKDISQEVSDDSSLRKLFCEFCAATALVSLARGGDIIEEQYQDYLNARKHVASFDDLLQEKINKMEDASAHDLVQKLAILLAFDFEAACQLKAWDDLGEIILKAEVCKCIRTYELMADCILSCHPPNKPPTQTLITNLKKIVNEAWSLDSVDSTKLAKYMRCLFHVAMSDNHDIAEQLLQQIKELAWVAAETEQPYPAEDLEYISIHAFNHAVDLYCNGEDEACKNWASVAINIAHVCTDEGALERKLQSKYLGLKWDTD